MRKLSKGRGPRLREEEVERMVQLYSEGKSLKAIGKDTKRHWQTVRKYVVRTLREQEGQEVRREALKSALVQHFQDLAGALQAMKALFRLPEPGESRAVAPPAWPPAGLERQTQLLLQALREGHVRDSPLWGWWDRWQRTVAAYTMAVPRLEERVDVEIERLHQAFGGCILMDSTTSVLLNQAFGTARGLGGYVLDKLLTVRDNEGRDDLWLGENTHLTEGRGNEVRKKLMELDGDMKDWPEVQALAASYRENLELRGKMEEEIEILSLRRAFPGRCRLCPV